MVESIIIIIIIIIIVHAVVNRAGKGPFTLAFFARVSPSAMAPPPNCYLCFSRAITRERCRERRGKERDRGRERGREGEREEKRGKSTQPEIKFGIRTIMLS
jgi:hypothetical protein